MTDGADGFTPMAGIGKCMRSFRAALQMLQTFRGDYY